MLRHWFDGALVREYLDRCIIVLTLVYDCVTFYKSMEDVVAWVVRQSDRFLYSIDGASFSVVRFGGYKKPTGFGDVSLALWALGQVFGKEHVVYHPGGSKASMSAYEQGARLALVSVDNTGAWPSVRRSRWFLEQVGDDDGV